MLLAIEIFLGGWVCDGGFIRFRRAPCGSRFGERISNQSHHKYMSGAQGRVINMRFVGY